MGVLQTGRTAVHDPPFHRSAPVRSLQLRQRDENSTLRANGYTIPTPGSTIDNSLYDY
jgi:hypothetical protein